MTNNNERDNAERNSVSHKIILYGAGQIGQEVANKFRRLNIPVECLCDSDPDKHGKEYSGLIVKSIDEVKSQYKKGDYKILFSLNDMNEKFIRSDLIEERIFDESDFIGDSYESYMLNAVMRKGHKDGADFEYYYKKAAKNYIQLDITREKLLKEALIKHYFVDKEALNTEFGKRDLYDHIYGRLDFYRKQTIPWIESLRTLTGARILEIGCGTGASTIALCEQGAEVLAVDVSDNSLDAARERAKIYELHPKFIKLNAEDIRIKLGGNFDFIIYAASMEHMTYPERINTIKAAYEMIAENQYIVLSDIPNRLWHTDRHTSKEAFYSWLPDPLAIDYAKFTQRANFNTCFEKDSGDNYIKLARWGRGVSYHEFEVALGQSGWEAASSMNDFLGIPDSLFKCILMMHGPAHIDSGFYDENLNLALRKTSNTIQAEA